jgi:hypothetical protein
VIEPEGLEKFSRLHFISVILFCNPVSSEARRIAAPTKSGLVPLMARTAGPAETAISRCTNGIPPVPAPSRDRLRACPDDSPTSKWHGS